MAKAITLPPPRELERTTRGLALLDAILSDEWEFRYYSFNAKWGKGQRLASMRNGEGEEWALIFTGDLAFLKGFAHEYQAGDPDELLAGLPKALAKLRKNTGYLIEDVSFAGWFNKRWTIRTAPKCARIASELLEMLDGSPKRYRAYAKEYFDADVPIEAIEHVLSGEPLDKELVARVSPERTLASLKKDLAEIGYGKS